MSPAATSGLEEWSSGLAARPGRTGSGLQTDFGFFFRMGDIGIKIEWLQSLIIIG